MRELRFFLKLAMVHWRNMLLGLVLALLTLLASVALLSLSGWFISAAAFAGLTAIAASQFNYFLPAAGVRFFALLRIASRYGERLVNHNVTFRILSRLRLWLYQHLEPLAPAYLLKFRSAELLNRMTADVEAMDNLFLRVLIPTLVALLTMILLGVALYTLSHFTAMLITVCLFFSLFCLPALGRCLAKKTGGLLVEVRAHLRVLVVDIVQGLPELLLANQAQRYVAHVAKSDAQLIGLQRKMAHIQGVTSGLYVLLLGMTLLLLAMVSVHYAHQHVFSGAMIALMLLGVMGAFEAIMPLPRAFQYLSETKASAQRLMAVQDEKPAVFFTSVTLTPPHDASICLQRVSFGYQPAPMQHLFKNVTLSIPHRQKLGIVGATGSGKSTLLHLIARSFNVDAGVIKIGGVDLTGLSEVDLRAQITMITQRIHIFNGTLRENLCIAQPEASDDALLQALAAVQLSDYVVELKQGLDTWLGEAGVKLSGGQARRVALARAILHNAPIWLLDEPTEGLDFETETALLSVLKTLIHDKTVVMVSHREAPLQLMDKKVHIEMLVQPSH